MKFSPITNENPEHRLLYSIRLFAVNLQMKAGSWVDFGVGSADHPAIILDADLDKSYWNFDILPEPAKATTVIAEFGSVQFYDFLKNRAEEKTYTLAFQFEKESRDFRGVLENESKWLRVEGRTLFEFKGSDIARIKADSEQIKAYRDRKLEQAEADRKRLYEKQSEEAEIVKIANQELPKQWTQATSPIIRGLTEPMLRAKYLSQFVAADRPHLKIIKFHAKEASSSALWSIQKDEYGLLPRYRYANQWFTIFIKNTKANQCFFQGFGIRQFYSGGGTYGESQIDTFDPPTFFNCDKMGSK